MKRIYNIIFTVLALIAFHPVLSAQPDIVIGDDGNPNRYSINSKGIGYAKGITGPDDNGNYFIHLHTFVTGDGTITHSDIPADIILVLDVSGSMDETLSSSVTYEAQASRSYSYNDINNSDLYYLYNGQYYEVQRNTQGGYYSQTRYYLRFNAGGWRYLNGTGNQNYRPDNAPTNANSTIFTGVLYKRVEITETKMDALKTAVKAFIETVEQNDPGEGKHNQISIIKFAGNTYYEDNDDGTSTNVTGNHKHSGYNSNQRNWMESDNPNFTDWHYRNPTEIVTDFIETTGNGAQTLTDAVDDLQPGGATAADYGMTKALALLNTLYEDGTPVRESNKTIVFFTDGDPNHGDGFDTSIASAAILKAKDIKDLKAYTDENGNEVKVSIFSISIFDSTTDTQRINNRNKYMNNLSSNYPTASNMDDGWQPGQPIDKYYQDASSGNLEDIFRSIASEAGGNKILNDATLTAVDVVSQSFNIPGDADDILIYEADVVSVATDGTLTFAPESEWTPNPPGVEIVPDEDNPNKITVTGFDYAANYCGTLTVDDEDPVPHGSKLVLRIPITMSDDAVGGPGVDTNGPESGIYVDGHNEVKFESPTVDLPVNLEIKKVDLEMGESAKFKIQRTPKANTPSASSPWEDVTTIFVTKSTSADPSVYVRGLDPRYHYRILEEDWSWSYNFVNATGEGYIVDPATNEKHVGTVTITDKAEVTSDKFVSNPITFNNSLKTKIEAKVHHAESKANNTFNGTDPVYVDSKTNTRNQNSGTQTN